MVRVLDVAAYILQEVGPMTAMKLQKLVYYSQAWSLVWDDVSLFPEEIKAWANGPVCPALYSAHRGMFNVSGTLGGDPDALDGEQQETVDSVIRFYGDKSSQWLSDLTHKERPWREVREGLSDGERGDVVITDAAMAEYYGGL